MADWLRVSMYSFAACMRVGRHVCVCVCVCVCVILCLVSVYAARTVGGIYVQYGVLMVGKQTVSCG
jgi:hypothetical protein